mmetsp:Transcript_50470/g.130061  ORF Transcript_50470/g.130061 Transcript_50470/m.130061 type:complete len:222 (-) Transcript_50470:1008-1673(-)
MSCSHASVKKRAHKEANKWRMRKPRSAIVHSYLPVRQLKSPPVARYAPIKTKYAIARASNSTGTMGKRMIDFTSSITLPAARVTFNANPIRGMIATTMRNTIEQITVPIIAITSPIVSSSNVAVMEKGRLSMLSRGARKVESIYPAFIHSSTTVTIQVAMMRTIVKTTMMGPMSFSRMSQRNESSTALPMVMARTNHSFIAASTMRLSSWAGLRRISLKSL